MKFTERLALIAEDNKEARDKFKNIPTHLLASKEIRRSPLYWKIYFMENRN
jgi:hypothetical protein